MILITGASGRVARRTAALLAGRPLRLMSRDPQRAPKLEGAEVVRGDFNEPKSLDAAFAEIATAFVVSGQAPPGERALLHRNAFEAAARAGVQHVVYLSLKGSGPDSLYPYCRDHYASEQFLAQTGVEHTVLRVAFYLDMFPGKFDRQGIIRGPGGDGRGAFISRTDTAEAAAAAVANPPGGILDLTGPELLGVADVALRLSAVAGKALHYRPEPAGETRRRLSQTGALQLAQDLEAGWFQAIAAGEQAPVSGDFRRLTGKPPQTLEAYLAAFPELLDALHEAEPR
jgi:NAD(P)H dehydrogenase (quinone)